MPLRYLKEGIKSQKKYLDVAKLFEAIGQLKIENDWLKKKLL